MEKAKLETLGFASVEEALGEKFHSSPRLLRSLNPGVRASRARARPSRCRTCWTRRPPARRPAWWWTSRTHRVTAFDAAGPRAGVVSRHHGQRSTTRCPSGSGRSRASPRSPTFNYNPDLFWDAEPAHAKAKIAAGPNNPVGVVWIDLSKPHYGIHGTPEPSTHRQDAVARLHPPDQLGRGGAGGPRGPGHPGHPAGVARRLRAAADVRASACSPGRRCCTRCLWRLPPRPGRRRTLRPRRSRVAEAPPTPRPPEGPAPATPAHARPSPPRPHASRATAPTSWLPYDPPSRARTRPCPAAAPGDLDRLKQRAPPAFPVSGYDRRQLRDNFAEMRGSRVHEAHRHAGPAWHAGAGRGRRRGEEAVRQQRRGPHGLPVRPQRDLLLLLRAPRPLRGRARRRARSLRKGETHRLRRDQRQRARPVRPTCTSRSSSSDAGQALVGGVAGQPVPALGARPSRSGRGSRGRRAQRPARSFQHQDQRPAPISSTETTPLMVGRVEAQAGCAQVRAQAPRPAATSDQSVMASTKAMGSHVYSAAPARAAQPDRDPQQRQRGQELVGGAEEHPEELVGARARGQQQGQRHQHGERGARDGAARGRSSPSSSCRM